MPNAQMRLVNAAKASPHAKFYNLSTAYTCILSICSNSMQYMWRINSFPAAIEADKRLACPNKILANRVVGVPQECQNVDDSISMIDCSSRATNDKNRA